MATHRQKYFAQGQPCPVVLTFGHDPLLFLVAAQNVPYGTPELAYAGAIGVPPSTCWRVPSPACPSPPMPRSPSRAPSCPTRRAARGPSASHRLLRQRGRQDTSCASIAYSTATTLSSLVHRRAAAGENTYALCVFRSALIWNDLQKAGVPDVVGVCCHEVGATRMFNVIAIKQRYPGRARQAALAAPAADRARTSRFVVIVDEDVDPYGPQP